MPMRASPRGIPAAAPTTKGTLVPPDSGTGAQVADWVADEVVDVVEEEDKVVDVVVIVRPAARDRVENLGIPVNRLWVALQHV